MTEEANGQFMLDLGGQYTSPSPSRLDEYQSHRNAAARRQAEKSAEGRDIGSIPEVANPERREACRRDLMLFCKTYFPDVFYLPWAEIQKETARRIQEAAINGGNFAIAMPRGSGKSSLCERAAIWSACYGYRKFILVIGATDSASKEMFQAIKSSFESNELLIEDFPEVCYPVQMLEGITNRCKGQTCNGERTFIEWNDGKLVFPTIRGSSISGSIIQTTSMTGRIRGMKHATATGKVRRPDFAIIDDPQTAESAKSVTQTKDRIKLINSDILGLAGPGIRLTAVMPCTVISPNDLADQLLNRDLNPEWRGCRFKLLDGFPKNLPLWQRYWEIRANGMREDRGPGEATQFYMAHRAEMDEGCRPTWPERFNPTEISGVQYAMNLYFSNKQTFLSEYQNTPEDMDYGDGEQVTASLIMEKLNNRPLDEVPYKATKLTMFVDVQKNLLYWMVMAFADDFTGWVLNYGAFPEQPLSIFTTRDAHPTYRDLYPGAGQEGALIKALQEFLIPALAKPYIREDGMEMTIDRCMIDAGWGETSDAIYTFIKESRLGAIVLPSKGVGVNATVRPISENPRHLGETISPYEWQIAAVKNKRHIRLMRYDTNWWKSFFRNRVFTAAGDPGSFTINGPGNDRFRLLADHLSSEYSVSEAAKGRRCDVWKLTPNRENHWLDGVIGCMVAASERGCALLIAPATASGKEAVHPQAQKPTPKKSTYAPRKNYTVNRQYGAG